jgi:biopolymer transport protein ExbD
MLLKRRQKQESEIPTASLPDIVFLLIIFFLVTTTIDTEKGLELGLPDLEEIRVPKKNISNIWINQAGEILLDKTRIEIGDITNLVKEKIMENPNLIVSVQSDRKTKYDVYIDVLDRLKKAGATKISIAEPIEYE